MQNIFYQDTGIKMTIQTAQTITSGMYERRDITNNHLSHKSTKELGITQTPGYTRGGIRCVGGVTIPCRLITPALIPILVSKLGTRNNPQSKPMCPRRSNI
jgi:hypothetical protein